MSAKALEYFGAVSAALDGLDTWLREEDSPAYKHDVIAVVVTNYLKRLRTSLESWDNKIAFSEKFRISQSESGFPAFQNVLDLENDQKGAKARLAAISSEDTIREEMVDFILRKKAFPSALQETMAGIGAAAQSHIGDLLEMHEKNMLSTKDIQRRKKLADEAFARRFDDVMKKHNSAKYVG